MKKGSVRSSRKKRTPSKISKPVSRPNRRPASKSQTTKSISTRSSKNNRSSDQAASLPYFFQERTDLPFSYNVTKLVLMARDPEWAFSYWDFSAKMWQWIEEFRQRERNFRSVMRLHNLDQKKIQDMDISLEARNWYIQLSPDASFEAELGFIDANGKFHLIVRSNRIRTPRNAPSQVVDPNWISSDFDEIYRLSSGGKAGMASELSSLFRKPPAK